MLIGSNHLLQAETIAAEPISQISQSTSGAEVQNAKALFDEGMRLFQQQTAESLRAAIPKLEEAARLYTAAGDRKKQATSFVWVGFIYNDLGEKQKALEYYNQSLPIWRAVGDRSGEANTLHNIGAVYANSGEKQKALSYYNQALSLYKAVGDRRGEAIILDSIGQMYHLRFVALPVWPKSELNKTDQSEKAKAISYYNQALPIWKMLGNREKEAQTLKSIGDIYSIYLKEKHKAIGYYNQALPIWKMLGNHEEEAQTLKLIGDIYNIYLKEKHKAIGYYNQALPIWKMLGNHEEEAQALISIGLFYDFELKDKHKAISCYQQALQLYKAIGDRMQASETLDLIGETFMSMGQEYQFTFKPEKAEESISYYNQALLIWKAMGNRAKEAFTLDVIGGIYDLLNKKQKALVYYNQALQLYKAVGDRPEEAKTLHTIGIIYSALGEKQKALFYFYQALLLSKASGNLHTEAYIFRDIGFLLEEQRQSTLAIAFFKQSINVIEAMRNDIRSTKEVHEAYIYAITNLEYGDIADRLLQQNRNLEALQVLDLLKAKELKDFLKDVKGNEITTKGIIILPEEQQILAPFNNSSIPFDPNAYLKSSNVKTLVQQLQETAVTQNLQLPAYNDLQTRLQGLGKRSALLYPLILQDRLELILFTPNSSPTRHTVQVSKEELNQTILTFRGALQRSNDASILQPAQKFYTWLLKPLEADLRKANIQTIIYAPDGQLRYIPLAALHDGKKWAVESYQINYVTAFSLASLKPRSTQPLRILAGAYDDSQIRTITINQKQFQFGPIPSAVPEVKNLAARFPQTTLLLGKDFNRQVINPNLMNQYGIIHLATHGKLVDGSPEDSFILLNNFEYVTLREIKDWKLPNVELVVLSACQTALGGKLGSGIEIIGLGYQLQVAQARAAIASLWEVSDDGTNSLMNFFYEQLHQGKRSSTEALASAQRAMIQKAKTVNKEGKRGSITVVQSPNKSQPPFSHPYYWAPFILIGNGL